MSTFRKIITVPVLGLLVFAGANLASASPQAEDKSYECMTDDGHGRTRPCSYGYQQKSTETPFECYTDDGHGRKRPCSTGYQNVENPFDCFTDDGNGRKRPCSTGVKP